MTATRTYTEQELAAAVRSTGLGIDTIARLIEEPTTTCYDHYISGIKPGEICPDCLRDWQEIAMADPDRLAASDG